LLDSLDALKAAGMPYVGAGRNLEEASKPVYFISGDIKIAILSATQIERLENPDTRGATDSSPGVFRCLNPSALCEAVSIAKQDSDFVIVFIHWGTENVAEPDWAQLDQAPKLAQAGADLIIGAHPHCLQGIQYYGEVPVIYSLGNFWFNSKTIDTGMVQVDITRDGISNFRFIPAIQSNCRTDLAYDAEKARILSYMQSLSKGVAIDQEGNVSKP
ncbi:MAG: CapA family protein, partial [Lachnospiraceae bacterium]|nr:CapA family protein [Lachnospiraceae bacterium]